LAAGYAGPRRIMMNAVARRRTSDHEAVAAYGKFVRVLDYLSTVYTMHGPLSINSARLC
jgi:hypothetical protein